MAKKEIEKIGKVSSASVLRNTGKGWGAWIALLEKAGSRSLSHKEMAAHLRKKYKLPVFWQHIVATGFELHIGRKGIGRNEKGEYLTMASRTFPVGAKAIWKFISSEEGQGLWLRPMAPLSLVAGEQFEVAGGIFGEVRTVKKFERFRLRWQDEDWAKPSVLQVYLHERDNGKTIFIFNHEKLPSEAMRVRMNAHWKNVLQELLLTLSAR